jgi:mannose-6-phosphate isomerase-like protein (cupin superfamily)
VPEPQHFTFAGASFDEVVAHDGHGTISSARVLDGRAGGAEWIDLVSVPPGCSIGEHTHADDEETYVIVSGTGAMTVDGTDLSVGQGDVVVNRAGGTHSLRNTGDAPLQLVVLDVALRQRST